MQFVISSFLHVNLYELVSFWILKLRVNLNRTVSKTVWLEICHIIVTFSLFVEKGFILAWVMFS